MHSVGIILSAILSVGAFGAAVSTNVNGITLFLQVTHMEVIAGERLPADMLVSNGSPFTLKFPWRVAPGGRDTAIGDFVITDEIGQLMRKTVPPWEWDRNVKDKALVFRPGEVHRFGGDVVYSYSLTNPGTYFVKAIAKVPATNATEAMYHETMVIETPSMEIKVIPRPEESSAPKPLYNIPPPADHTQIHRAIEQELKAFPPLQITHPKVDPVSPIPRTGSSRPSLPKAQTTAASGGQQRDSNPVEPGAVSQTPRSRSVYYGLVVLVLGGICGVLIWRSRGKHNPIK